MIITIPVKYIFNGVLSHTSDQSFERTDMHCIKCGRPNLFRETEDDVEAGYRCFCPSCGAWFHSHCEDNKAECNGISPEDQVFTVLKALHLEREENDE